MEDHNLCKINSLKMEDRNKDRSKRKHKKKKCYSCDVCKISCTNKSHFVAHQMIHTGEKPFACEICGKRFIRKGDLTNHKLTHTSESLYLCKICKKSFRNNSNLNTHHKRKHVKIRPHECDICDKSFILPSELRNHHRIHTGEKLYHCAECGQAFATSSNLIRHKKRIHAKNNEPINFVQCLEVIKDEKDIKDEVIDDLGVKDIKDEVTDDLYDKDPLFVVSTPRIYLQ